MREDRQGLCGWWSVEQKASAEARGRCAWPWRGGSAAEVESALSLTLPFTGTLGPLPGMPWAFIEGTELWRLRGEGFLF